jgi:hypothetical protein
MALFERRTRTYPTYERRSDPAYGRPTERVVEERPGFRVGFFRWLLGTIAATFLWILLAIAAIVVLLILI